MSERARTPWQGDWRRRLQTKLESLGFSSLDEFLDANPGTSYVTLAGQLGDANVAAMQIYGEQIRAASFRGELRYVAADCLVRFLAQHIKRGWGRGRHFPFRLASALGDWQAVVQQFGGGDDRLKARLDAISSALKTIQPAEGWLPTAPSDSIIQRAFEQGWPE